MMEDNFARAVNLTDGVAFMYQRPMSPRGIEPRAPHWRTVMKRA
jgi:hypothetical protein